MQLLLVSKLHREVGVIHKIYTEVNAFLFFFSFNDGLQTNVKGDYRHLLDQSALMSTLSCPLFFHTSLSSYFRYFDLKFVSFCLKIFTSQQNMLNVFFTMTNLTFIYTSDSIRYFNTHLLDSISPSIPAQICTVFSCK